MRAPVSTAIAIAVGLIVLLGYFLPVDQITTLRVILLDWGVILAAVALLIGIGNLIYVHRQKVAQAQASSVYSMVLLIALFLTLAVVGWFGPTHSNSMWIFNYIQVPIESSLLAILAVLLAYALARLLRRRTDPFSLVFVATTVIILISTAPLLGVEMPGLGDLRAWITQVPAVAGARGILLGIALGIIATGIRILIGADRPYGG
jgi:cytochrome bd-type quinol oxidase subunit 2